MSEPQNKLILVDFDRTLFNLDLFYHEVWHALAKTFGFVADESLRDLPKYYYKPHEGYHGTYAFAKHVQAHVPHLQEAELPALLHDIMPTSKGFLYDDAKEVFTWQNAHDVRILSYGERSVQDLKLSFCPELADVSKDIILTPKPAFIAEHFTGRQGYLIDDKLEQDLPAGMSQIHILRNQVLENNPKSAMIVVNSLKQATQYL